MTTVSHYDTLGVRKGATTDEIRKAYRRRAKQAHPDRQGGDHTAMVAINRAYETLTDPEKRARYDRTGDDGPPPPSLDMRAMQLLSEMLVHHLQRLPEDADLLTSLRENIETNIRDLPNDIAQCEKVIASLEKRRKRFKLKKAAAAQHDFVDAVFERQLGALAEEKEHLRAHAEVLQRARVLLKNYTYQAPPAQPKAGASVAASVDMSKMFEAALEAAFSASR